MKRPTDEQCLTHAQIGSSSPQVRHAMWHPQWQGHSHQCVVEFDARQPHDDSAGGPASFAVYEFHNGDNPTATCCNVRDYSDPMQLIEFGTSVLEFQANAGYRLDAVSIGHLRELAARLAAIADIVLPSASSSAATDMDLLLDMLRRADIVCRPIERRQDASMQLTVDGSKPGVGYSGFSAVFLFKADGRLDAVGGEE